MPFKIKRFSFCGRSSITLVSFTVIVLVTLLVGCEKRESSHRTFSSTCGTPKTSTDARNPAEVPEDTEHAESAERAEDIEYIQNRTNNPQAAPSTTSSLRPGFYDVRRVVDGDTLLLKDGKRIRLLGVDTPETVKPHTPPQPWGPEASAYTKNFCQTGTVWLEFDTEPTDKYGRYLAYVYDTNKSKMLNEQLLRNGLGKFLPYFPYSDEKKKLFSAAQSEAQREQLGIWSNSP